MFTVRTIGLATVATIFVTGFSTIQSATGLARGGINADAIRQKCEFYRTKALFGNRQARTGQISEGQRVALWLRYRDCVGSKDYLVPLEFKKGGKRYN